MTPKKKLQLFSCIAIYPLFSTFLMTMIWQITQQYLAPFFGGYYFKWVYLYTEYNDDWLATSYLTATRWIYFIYIFAYVALLILTALALFRRNGKAICIWAICGFWIADIVWIVLNLINTGVQWQSYVLIGEHVIFLFFAALFSVYYLKFKKEFPELFRKKKRYRNAYRNRF